MAGFAPLRCRRFSQLRDHDVTSQEAGVVTNLGFCLGVFAKPGRFRVLFAVRMAQRGVTCESKWRSTTEAAAQVSEQCLRGHLSPDR